MISKHVHHSKSMFTISKRDFYSGRSVIVQGISLSEDAVANIQSGTGLYYTPHGSNKPTVWIPLAETHNDEIPPSEQPQMDNTDLPYRA